MGAGNLQQILRCNGNTQQIKFDLLLGDPLSIQKYQNLLA
jgi:hypothetical protein